MSGNALAEKIPDVYFDWYARFIPGAIGVIVYFYTIKSFPDISATSLLLYAIIAYLSGHLIQPVSSLIVRFLQWTIRSDNSKYTKAKVNKQNQRIVDKVSKAHAEAVGMLSTMLIVLAISIYLKSWQNLNIFIMLYCVFASIERTFSRKNKINDLP